MIFIRTYDESTNAALSKSYTNPIDRARSNVLSYLKLVWGVSAFDLFRATETRLVFSALQFSPIKLEGHFVASKFWHEMKSVPLSFRFSVKGLLMQRGNAFKTLVHKQVVTPKFTCWYNRYIEEILKKLLRGRSVILYTVPPNSKTFSHWKRKCHVHTFGKFFSKCPPFFFFFLIFL